MCDEVDKLEELYNQLPEDIPHFSDLLVSVDNDVFEYKSGGGKFTSVSLKDSPDINIAESELISGSKVEFHDHPSSYEIIIILEGNMIVNFKNRQVSLKKFDYLVIDKGRPHNAEVTEDTKFIALTVPRDEGFPRKK